jgi:hypothetical protein
MMGLRIGPCADVLGPERPYRYRYRELRFVSCLVRVG